MAELELNIKRINDKLVKLLKRYQLLLKDNERQSNLIATLRQEKESNAQTIAALQQQADILKASTGQMSADDKKGFEKNINQYIKEIDKCIGLLSE
jgi:CHASE3 domain sensor protein